MKLRKIALCSLFTAFTLCLSIHAKEATAATPVEVKVIPTEISQPPYSVGQLPSELGHYIVREGHTTINFRLVNNQIRVYWLDEDGLIAEPESTGGSVRLKGKPKIRDFFGLSPLSGEAGVGSAGIVKPPHMFTVYLSLEQPESGELVTNNFRYTIAMDLEAGSSEPK